MRVSHKFSAEFDDDNLIAAGGLVPVTGLAQSAGLSDLVGEHVTVAGSSGANAKVKVAALVAGMVAGADSISDMDLIRHGGMGRAFTELRAPTTLGPICGATRLGTCASWTRSPPGCSWRWLPECPRWSLARRRWPMSTWMTRSARPTAMRSRALVMGIAASRASTRWWPRCPLRRQHR